MCGIAGIADLAGRRPVPTGSIRDMAAALFHRGPDEDGFLEEPGLALASRRLSIVGLADGRQPICNEDRSVAVVYNGELFDYPERRAELEAKGHRFTTHCDTELIPHLWENHHEDTFQRLRGQFALALWDRKRRLLVLARDRFGICPLYWTRQGDWLLFASEIKALLASGMVEARPDVRGIDNVFNFFSLPAPLTCFQGVQALIPGHYLRLELALPGGAPRLDDRVYWQIDFPDQGQEEDPPHAGRLVDQFEEVLLGAVQRRLRADVPVVSYLSGGIDSSTVVAMTCKALGRPIPTFTIRIMEPSLDETSDAAVVSRHVGAEPVVVRCGDAEVLDTYARLIRAAEGPVVDTSCAALLLLAQEVHARGYKAALTGEGADEWLAGYSSFKIHKALGLLDAIPGLPLSQLVRRLYLNVLGGKGRDWLWWQRAAAASAGHSAFHEVYNLMSLSRLRFYSEPMRAALAGYMPWQAVQPDLDRLRRWHPLNRSLYWGARIHLAGHLLSSKGDRVAMHSSVETRYPFLDEEVFNFLARLHPRWKLHGFREKYLLRLLGERWLPRTVAWRPKGMFRAPFDSFFGRRVSAWVDELLSAAALRRTGYFDPQAVTHWRTAFRGLPRQSHLRIGVEMGLVAVVATQLWHHTFLDGNLAALPAYTCNGRASGVDIPLSAAPLQK